MSSVVTIDPNNINMIVSKALLSTTYLTLLLRAIVAEKPCKLACPDPFPPGHRNIGNAWWAIGNEASGAYITDLTTTLEVPAKPDGVMGLRVINSAMDNSVSIGLLHLPHHYDVFNLPKSF